MEHGLGYTDLDPALQALNMIYPMDELTEQIGGNSSQSQSETEERSKEKSKV